MSKDDVGSSVDGEPLIDLSASSKESLDSKGQGEMPNETEETAKQQDSGNVENATDSTNNEVVMATKVVSSNTEPVSQKLDEAEGGEDVDKVDKLSMLAQQIDDFDFSPIFDKASVPASVADNANQTVDLVSNLNDSDLVDNLIKESEVDLADSNKNDTDKGEVTPVVADTAEDDNGSSPSDDNETEVVDTVELEEDTPQNGEMSASTESEGFQEEKVEEEVEKKKNATKENKAQLNKDNNQKQETASPTKSSKSKKKEDKSIGRWKLLILLELKSCLTFLVFHLKRNIS